MVVLDVRENGGAGRGLVYYPPHPQAQPQCNLHMLDFHIGCCLHRVSLKIKEIVTAMVKAAILGRLMMLNLPLLTPKRKINHTHTHTPRITPSLTWRRFQSASAGALLHSTHRNTSEPACKQSNQANPFLLRMSQHVLMNEEGSIPRSPSA